MTPLYALDIGARGLAIGMLLPLVAALLRARQKSWASRLAALFCIGAMAYSLCSQPDIESGPIGLRLVLIPICAGNPVVLWTLVEALSDDRFKPSASHVAAWLILAGAGVATVLALPFAGSVLFALTLCMLGLAVTAALRGLSDDLFQPRRRLRVLSVAGIVIFILAASGARLIYGSGPMPLGLVAVGAIGFAAVSGYVSLSMLDLSDLTILRSQQKAAKSGGPQDGYFL